MFAPTWPWCSVCGAQLKTEQELIEHRCAYQYEIYLGEKQ